MCFLRAPLQTIVLRASLRKHRSNIDIWNTLWSIIGAAQGFSENVGARTLYFHVVPGMPVPALRVAGQAVMACFAIGSQHEALSRCFASALSDGSCMSVACRARNADRAGRWHLNMDKAQHACRSCAAECTSVSAIRLIEWLLSDKLPSTC
jgi:hypothetical protein